MSSHTPQRIAIVGGGVAGIVTAYLLQDRFSVTIFEKNDYLGGHTNTVTINSGPDTGLAVDTGFIVLNDKTYPLFHRFLERLGVPVRYGDMSFSYFCERSGLQYAGTTLSGLFAQRANLFSPKFLKFLAELTRFCIRGQRDLEQSVLGELTLAQYLEQGGFSRPLIDDYLLPMGSAIWSTPRAGICDFPASTFLRFFSNHGLLSLRNRPRWQTVVGGSHAYVKKFVAEFKGEIELNAPISSISRTANGVEISPLNGTPIGFDAVVIAAHADEALQMLTDPSPEERELLGAWSYEQNETVLHTDSTVLPPNKRAWASWNYIRPADDSTNSPTSVTYHMNRLQGFEASEQYCVTLNRTQAISPQRILKKFFYTHPVYDNQSVASQTSLSKLNGQRNTYFCGSYFGYGFHEDAIRSANEVARHFGATL